MTGGVVLFTGLSGAGKTSIATAVHAQLHGTRSVEVLDGDEMRGFLSKGLSFTPEDRDTNVHRIAYVARLLAKQGVLVLVAVIAPYAKTRAELRQLSEHAGHAFVEIYVNAPLETVIARDVKGLYRRALAGELQMVTGVDAPYEASSSPDLELRTDHEQVPSCADRVIGVLVARGLVCS